MSEQKKPNLPAIVKDLGLAVQVDTLNTLLNQSPPRDWLRVHKGNQYQPIDRVKNSLTTVFLEYDWSIKTVQIVANSILVTGSLSVVNPITGRPRCVDGIGAWPIQLAKGSKPLEIENIVQDAIQKNAPAAESLALKNAASKLGKLFSDGQSEVDFNPMYSREVPLDEIKKSQQKQSENENDHYSDD